jgi:hypothetical protein
VQVITIAGNEKDRKVSKEIALSSDLYLVCVQALNLIGRKATLRITSDKTISFKHAKPEYFVFLF